MTNLMNNAYKFTSLNTDTTIEFGYFKETYFVRDNGAGFEMRHVGKLFAPFQRLHANKDFPGSGIGLATVKRIIQRHSGTIWAEAEVNKGATFYFTL
jgi:light-regulated signal transduction histidine kinase (bacteriophytochrome)